MTETTTVKIEIVCDIRLDGTIQTLQAGEFMHLPVDKAQKLIDAGYAKPHTICADDYCHLVAYFGEKDPGGDCWCYMKLHHADIWVHHRQAFTKGDLDEARSAFDEMLSTWGTRNRMVQQEQIAGTIQIQRKY